MDASDIRWGNQVFKRLLKNIQTVIKGQEESIRLIIAGLAARGHILLEDNPGTGKTTLAKALAKSINAQFKRIQFTPDLLPSDIIGVSIFDQAQKIFRLHKGPVFTNILLADEINRASPRTQSALLESMAEGQVSIDGRLMNLADLFFVIATQNPVEARGTYPLPEAQMDRFALKMKLGYVSREDEVRVLSLQETDGRHPVDAITACITLEECRRFQQIASGIHITGELKTYIVSLINETRTKPGVLVGASPRASIALMKTAQALALFDELDFVTADHIQLLAPFVIAHRMVLDSGALFSGMTPEAVVRDIIESVPVPV